MYLYIYILIISHRRNDKVVCVYEGERMKALETESSSWILRGGTATSRSFLEHRQQRRRRFEEKRFE